MGEDRNKIHARICDEKQALALMLMGGWVDEENNRPVDKYFVDWKNNRASTEDRDAAKKAHGAMAEILRSGLPLTQDFRNQLAALFDSSPDTHPAITRRLVFKHRSAGNRPDSKANTAVAEYIYERIRNNRGNGAESAVKSAMDHFDLERDVIKKIWGRYRKPLEEIYGTLPKKPKR